MVGLELLHLHAADIGDNEILNGGKVGFVGFGCPLVLAALFRQPVHQELIIPYISSMEMQKLKPYHMENLYTTLSKTPCGSYIEGKKQESASGQFMLDLLFSVRCLLFCGKALPFVAALAVLIFVGVADAVRVAALRNIRIIAKIMRMEVLL